MKKILISILIVLLLVLSYFVIWQGIKFIKIKSIKDVKSASTKLDEDMNKANELTNQTYPSETKELEEAIRKLKLSKQEYENKSKYSIDETTASAVEVKTYKIHFLWTILGNYRKDEGVRSLNLDLKTTNTKDVYDLQFTLVGNYVGITDFIYDIENDQQLNFEIKNFTVSTQSNAQATNNLPNNMMGNGNTLTNSILPNTSKNNDISTNKTNTSSTNTNTNNKKTSDDTVLQATFTVENIGITLD